MVSLTPASGDAEIDLTSDVHLPSQANLPSEYFKIRIVSAIFELTAKPHDDKITFRFLVLPEHRLPVTDLAKFLALRGMMAAGPVDCQVRKDDVPFLSGTISLTGFAEHPGWAQVRDFLVHVASRVTPDRLPAAAALALTDLRGRTAEIADFLALTGNAELLVSTDEAMDGLLVGTACTVLKTARVDFDACTACTIVRRRGEIEAGEGVGFVLRLGAPACMRTMVLIGPSASRSDVIDKELARLAEAESRGVTSPVIVIPSTARGITLLIAWTAPGSDLPRGPSGGSASRRDA